jgi:GTP-binding protein
MRSENSIRRADICCLVIDASLGVTAQDKKIAGIIQEANKPCIIALNKWDLIKDQTSDKESLGEVLESMREELFFIRYAPSMLVSAKTGAELTRLFKTIERIQKESQFRIGTGVLNRLLAEAIAKHPPTIRAGKRLKILFGTQPDRPGGKPIPTPEFVLFVNDEKLLDQSYHRYLDTQIREKAPYTGLPIQLHLRARTPRDKSNDTRGQKFGRNPETGGRPTGRRPRSGHSNKKADKPKRRLGG